MTPDGEHGCPLPVDPDLEVEGPPGDPQLGQVVIMLLAGTLAGLRDRLAHDGFDDAAELVAYMVDAADDYLSRVGPRPVER